MAGRTGSLGKAACAAAAEACACHNLRKASRAVTQLFNASLLPTGLRSTQFAMLAVVRAEEPVTLGQLAQALVMDRSTLSRNLQPLYRKGLLRIGRTSGERLGRVRLTAKGQRVLSAALPLWKRAQKQFEEQVGAVKSRTLLELLPRAADVSTGG